MTTHRPPGTPVAVFTGRHGRFLLLLVLIVLTGCTGLRSTTPTTALATPTSTITILSAATPPHMLSATPSRPPGTPTNTALGEWVAAGALGFGRSGHTATLLSDGHVLVAGGEGGSAPLASVEQYDLQTNHWAAASPLGQARSSHTATLLASGEVLVVGGMVASAGVVSTTPTVELFDPVTERWRAGSPLNQARSAHTATRLPGGRVLVVGGEVLEAATRQSRPVASAELYDPESDTWAVVAAPKRARIGHTATLLTDGRVLVAGGEISTGGIQRDVTATAEIFDPAADRWVATGTLGFARTDHTATRLADGRVLLVGGRTIGGTPTDSTEVYDPVRGGWLSAASTVPPRADHTATRLQDGRVVIVGGLTRDALVPLASAERYDVATNSWAPLPVPSARIGQRALLLTDGSLLIVGGRAAAGRYVETAERFVPRGIVPATPSTSATPRLTATVAPTLIVPTTVVPVVPPATVVVPYPTVLPPTNTLPAPAPPAPTETIPAPTATASPQPSIVPPLTTTVPTLTVPPVSTSSVLPSPTVLPIIPAPTQAVSRVTPTVVPTATPIATVNAAQTGTIFGTIQFCSARQCGPAAGAVVATDSGATRTDDGGVYALSGVAAGHVRVNVSYTLGSGDTYTASQAVTVPAGGRVQLNFTLQPAAAVPNLPAGGQIPTHSPDSGPNSLWLPHLTGPRRAAR